MNTEPNKEQYINNELWQLHSLWYISINFSMFGDLGSCLILWIWQGVERFNLYMCCCYRHRLCGVVSIISFSSLNFSIWILAKEEEKEEECLSFSLSHNLMQIIWSLMNRRWSERKDEDECDAVRICLRTFFISKKWLKVTNFNFGLTNKCAEKAKQRSVLVEKSDPSHSNQRETSLIELLVQMDYVAFLLFIFRPFSNKSHNC